MSDTIKWGSLGVCVITAVISISGTSHELNGDRSGTMRACDAELHQLLVTRDPPELQRAAILVRALGCDVAWRWTPPMAPAP